MTSAPGEDAADTEAPGTDETGLPIHSEWHRYEFPGTAIVEAVAATVGRSITDLPPLQEVVAIDALDELLTRKPPEASENLTVSFTYAGADVAVSRTGSIEVHTRPTERA